ncbi:MAG: transglutaminase-like domain-containing protein [Thaumarchaeota archaeon]|nr:transglutaminase-like domain-containing protein [Nitrososphaerota archaeon]
MPTSRKQILDYYKSPGLMTSPGKYAKELRKLPRDVGELAKIVQGLGIHQFVAEPFYGVPISEERLENESHIRRLDGLLGGILALKDQPLSIPRKPEQRLAGVCHHFAVLLVGMLRARGVPARSRYGFGDYFNPGFYEDHSLCEYWNAKEKRWVLVDPQFDQYWQKNVKHDVLDVPRDHFLVAGEPWIRCRKEELDPSKFGIFNGNLRGLWFVAGSIVKDLAALNKMELLQWDAWGARAPRPNNRMQDKKRLRFFDELAKLIAADPDASFDKLRRLYKEKKNRLVVPDRVFNAGRGHLEYI